MTNEVGNGPAAGPIADAPDGALRLTAAELLAELDNLGRRPPGFPVSIEWLRHVRDTTISAAARIRELAAQREQLGELLEGLRRTLSADFDPDKPFIRAIDIWLPLLLPSPPVAEGSPAGALHPTPTKDSSHE
jgi:hypothetical protein